MSGFEQDAATVTWNGDFAKGFLGLLGHQQAIGHAFHITSDEVLTWNQIYEGLAETLGVKPNLVRHVKPKSVEGNGMLVCALLVARPRRGEKPG